MTHLSLFFIFLTIHTVANGTKNSKFVLMKRYAVICTLILALLGSGLCSCSSSRNAYNRDDIYSGSMPAKKKKKHGKQKGSTAHRYDRPADDAAMTRDAKKVIDEARKWLGTPYRYGGDSARGMDCSGLTCTAFEKAIGLKLPRNSREQAEFSRRIRRSELQPGDLVFFASRRGGDRINHVAIYLGNNSMIHSSTSQGVVVSDLDEEYWKSHFHSCGRVL